MADIILAEISGQAWLIQGERHLDELLFGSLASHISIEIIQCESKSAVTTLWREHEGQDRDVSHLWLIHPGILGRAKRVSGSAAIVFTEWSASLDKAAVAVIESVAEAATQQADDVVVLVRYVADDAPAMARDLADLRSGLLEARFAALGVAAGRMTRETRPATQPGEGDRIDVVVRPPSP